MFIPKLNSLHTFSHKIMERQAAIASTEQNNKNRNKYTVLSYNYL